MIKKAFVFVGCGMLVFSLALILANLWAPALDPAAKDMLERELSSPTPAQVEAYKYTLGIGSPQDSSPLELGQTVYEAIGNSSEQANNLRRSASEGASKLDLKVYCRLPSECKEEELQELKEKLQSPEGQLSVKRYSELLAYPGIGIDVPFNMDALAFPAITLFNLAKQRFFRIDQLWASGNEQKALEILLEQRDFYAASIKLPNSLLFSVIAVNIIDDSQTFLRDHQERIKKLGLLKDSSQANISVDFNQIRDHTLSVEFRVVASSLDLVADDPVTALMVSSLEENQATKQSFLKRTLKSITGLAMSPFLVKSATLNDYYAHLRKGSSDKCVLNNEGCGSRREMSFTDYLYNPIGNLLNQIMTINIGYTLQKVKTKVDLINQAVVTN
ncbi:MAG: hypothetical protein HRT45_04530 [Bdellovibrionales bacterium]|nr:hypothetical protein [Bdellovibrionales bacterium]